MPDHLAVHHGAGTWADGPTVGLPERGKGSVTSADITGAVANGQAHAYTEEESRAATDHREEHDHGDGGNEADGASHHGRGRALNGVHETEPVPDETAGPYISCTNAASSGP